MSPITSPHIQVSVGMGMMVGGDSLAQLSAVYSKDMVQEVDQVQWAGI